MKTLFSQTFVVFLALMCALLIIVAGIFLVGMRRSIQDWNIYRRHALQNLIVPHLQQAYRRDGTLTRGSVAEALSGILTNNQYVYVLDTDRQPVFLYYGGEDLLLEGGTAMEHVLQALEQSQEMMRAVLDGDRPIAFLRANTLGFLSDVANRRFVRSVGISVVSGMLVSLFLALLVAYLFSRYVSRQATLVGAGLQRLSRGERSVRFPQHSPRELQAIADSAGTLQQQLCEEARLRRQWAEDIAHDLRTPIAALKTQFEGLKDGYIRNTPQRMVALFSELLMLEGLVNDLRELNRMESPEMTLELETIDAARFAAGIGRTFNLFSERYRAGFSVTCSIERFEADERLLSRALDNVLRNAFEHVEHDGDVRLTIYGRDDEVVFEVSNSGHVDEEEIPRLFDRLYRGGNDRRSAGSGLGLAITKAIIELHAGSVTLFQRAARTCVQLQLPVTAGLSTLHRDRYVP
ncbi:MAG: sensor histidine kinase [Spirochaetaceae bacterium]|nr:MAG: sensor histidine kinase [Spirochaetaceae bacterium]